MGPHPTHPTESSATDADWLLTDTELAERLRDNELALRRLTAERAAILATIEHRHLWAAEHRSMAAYLRATTNCSTGTANRDRRRAHLLHLHPTLAAAVRNGHIAPDQLDQITRITTNPRIRHLLPTIVDVLTDLAEHTSHHEFNTRITQLIALLDDDGTYTDLTDHLQHRHAHVIEIGGQLRITAHGGDAVQAAQIQAIFEHFVDLEHRNDLDTRRRQHGDHADQHPLPRSHPQRCFDALTAIFRAAHANPGGGTAPRTIVNIVVDAHTVHDTLTHAGITLPDNRTIVLDHDGHPQHPDPTPTRALIADLVADPDIIRTRRCSTTNGTPVHPSLLLRSLLTDHVRRVVIDSRSVVTDLGHTRRLFTGNARQAALLLATTCQFPGCTQPARWSQIDHNHEHHRGGATDQHNANTACAHHNRLKHRRHWTTRRDPHGRPYTRQPDGTIILPIGERPPDLTPHDLEHIARERACQLTAVRRAAVSRDQSRRRPP